MEGGVIAAEGQQLAVPRQQRGGVGDITEADGGTRQHANTVIAGHRPSDTGTRAYQTDDLMAQQQQGAHGGLADGARGTEHQDALGGDRRAGGLG